MLVVYGLLCCEDYRWWWRAFLVPAASSAYVFLYAMYLSVFYLRLDGTRSLTCLSANICEGFYASLAFFAYASLVSAAFGLIMGSVGFFVRARLS